jgi:hypothetical protein
MGAKHKHKNVDTTDSVMMTFLNKIHLCAIVLYHMQPHAYKHLIWKFLIQRSRVPVPRTSMPTVLQLKPVHAHLQ